MDTEERFRQLEAKMDEVLLRLSELLEKKQIEEKVSENVVKPESAREFFLRFNPKLDTDKTLVALYFLEKKGASSVTSIDITEALKEMREPSPKNISDKLQLLDKRGFLTSAGQEGKLKCWLVSRSGENYLTEMAQNGKRD